VGTARRERYGPGGTGDDLSQRVSTSSAVTPRLKSWLDCARSRGLLQTEPRPGGRGQGVRAGRSFQEVQAQTAESRGGERAHMRLGGLTRKRTRPALDYTMTNFLLIANHPPGLLGAASTDRAFPSRHGSSARTSRLHVRNPGSGSRLITSEWPSGQNRQGSTSARRAFLRQLATIRPITVVKQTRRH
jgi:hypothetical protein